MRQYLYCDMRIYFFDDLFRTLDEEKNGRCFNSPFNDVTTKISSVVHVDGSWSDE